ncbi:MAG: hypothetical protein WDN04_24790 [Rhodospirillales bacterium]
MDLRYTSEQQKFRAEVRAWMAVHAPSFQKLPSLESRAGYDAHVAWERELATATGAWSPGRKNMAAAIWT